MQKEKILIVDDSEMNRSILADMLSDNYEIIEAADGREAVSVLHRRVDISLVLLDVVMPNMDGFEVLSVMNRNGWIEQIPVIMVSAENSPTYVERAYELGVTDFITRPFDMFIVRRRVINTLMLYGKQKELVRLVDEQIYEKEQRSNLMIDILSHVVEFRNGESGLHIQNVRHLTRFFLRELMKRTDRYQFSEEDISLITTASALHDIGKIAIHETILNKPGKLTDAEFAVMKTHTTIGSQMLERVVMEDESALVKVAYEICRWHHERYDGKGYPDGLVGDEIPISAQVVALADVYDALTSKRVYKDAYSNEVAIQMIATGECGAFNPLLISCLLENADILPYQMNQPTPAVNKQQEVRKYMEVVSRVSRQGISKRTLRLLDYERMKNSFFASIADDILFEYTVSPPVLNISSRAAQKLGISEAIADPMNDPEVLHIMNTESWQKASALLRSTTPEKPDATLTIPLFCNGEERLHHIIARSVWSEDIPPQYEGAFGKAIEIPNIQDLKEDKS